MNVLQIYKFIGAIIGTMIILVGIGFLAKIIYTPIEDNGTGYALSVPESQGAGTAETNTVPEATNKTSVVAQPATTNDTNQAATTTAEPANAAATKLADASSASGGASALSVLLANASVEKGQQLERKCAACHDASKGGRNKFGPALYDIIGSPIAGNATYKYSAALKAMGANGDIWTYEALDAFLTKPRDFAPGTKMSFRGFSKAEDRANLLAYFQTLSDSPVAFP